MDPNTVFPVTKAITSLENIAKDLKSDLFRFGVVTGIEMAIVLAIGAIYKDNLYPLILAVLICGATNLYIIHRASALREAVEQRRSAVQEGARLKEQLQQDFEKDARIALDSLAISAQGIIEPREAGVLVKGWKTNLVVRGVNGTWQLLADILAISLKAEYPEEGPI